MSFMTSGKCTYCETYDFYNALGECLQCGHSNQDHSPTTSTAPATNSFPTNIHTRSRSHCTVISKSNDGSFSHIEYGASRRINGNVIINNNSNHRRNRHGNEFGNRFLYENKFILNDHESIIDFLFHLSFLFLRFGDNINIETMSPTNKNNDDLNNTSKKPMSINKMRSQDCDNNHGFYDILVDLVWSHKQFTQTETLFYNLIYVHKIVSQLCCNNNDNNNNKHDNNNNNSNNNNHDFKYNDKMGESNMYNRVSTTSTIYHSYNNHEDAKSEETINGYPCVNFEQNQRERVMSSWADVNNVNNGNKDMNGMKYEKYFQILCDNYSKLMTKSESEYTMVITEAIYKWMTDYWDDDFVNNETALQLFEQWLKIETPDWTCYRSNQIIIMQTEMIMRSQDCNENKEDSGSDDSNELECYKYNNYKKKNKCNNEMGYRLDNSDTSFYDRTKILIEEMMTLYSQYKRDSVSSENEKSEKSEKSKKKAIEHRNAPRTHFTDLNSQFLRNTSAETLAKQITYLTSKSFERIDAREWFIDNNKLNDQIYPYRINTVKQYEGLTYWLRDSIINEENFQNRILLIEKIYQLCLELIKLDNYYSLFAVFNATQCCEILKLKKCINYVKNNNKNLYNKFNRQLDLYFISKDKSKNLGKKIKEIHENTIVKQPCIPDIRKFKQNVDRIGQRCDLQWNNYQNKNSNLKNQINFEKFINIGIEIKKIEKYQVIWYDDDDLKPNAKILSFLIDIFEVYSRPGHYCSEKHVKIAQNLNKNDSGSLVSVLRRKK